MVHGAAKTMKYEKGYSKRVSPSKDRTKKKVIYSTVKKSDENQPMQKLSALPQDLVEPQQEELLTPEFILKSYTNKKNGEEKPVRSILEEVPYQDKTIGDCKPTTVSILELLSKKDNLQKLANSVSKAVEEAKTTAGPIDIPVKPITMKTPPSTPPKKSASNGERFAGLSSSPAPSTLPQPFFSFLDQELSNGKVEDARDTRNQPEQLPPKLLKAASTPLLPTSHAHQYASSTPQPSRVEHFANIAQPQLTAPQPTKGGKNRKPSPPTRQKPSAPRDISAPIPRSDSVAISVPARTMNHSPPSNPHLDELSTQLRMMLNIKPL